MIAHAKVLWTISCTPQQRVLSARFQPSALRFLGGGGHTDSLSV